MVESLFTLSGVSLQKSGQQVLSDVSLQLPAKAWTCVVGPNGAGKSSLLRTLAGLERIEGQVMLYQQGLNQLPARQRAMQIAWLGQSLDHDLDWSVEGLLRMGRFARAPGWPAWRRRDEAAVEHILQTLGLANLRQRRLSQLSAGQRQRARLGRLLTSEAPVLLMDEPVTNLDVPHQVDWWRWVGQWLKQGQDLSLDRSLVTVLHELPLAMQAHHLVVMAHGRVVHSGPPTDAATRDAVEAVFQRRLRLERQADQWVTLWVRGPE